MIKYFMRLKSFVERNINRNFSSKVTSIVNILQSHNIGEKVEIKGWVKSIRKQKENVFIDLNDGSTQNKLQILISQSLVPETINTGTSLTAEGTLHLSPKNQVELLAENLKVIGKCVLSDGYPFAPRKKYPPEYIRQYLHLRPRTNSFSSLLRVRSAAILGIHNYLCSEGYINVHTPILTSNDCEGAGEVFKAIPDNEKLIKEMAKEDATFEEAFFDAKTFLSVSGQLHLEAVVHGLSKAYTFGPIFRAENSRTRLHLSEFYMLEAEIAFLEKLKDLIAIIEKLLKSITKNLLDTCETDVRVCRDDKNDLNMSWIDTNFPVLSYNEAAKILKNHRKKFKNEFNYEEGLSRDHEIFLVNHCGGVPTFIINWPKAIKPFYMKECEDDRLKVAALDLLAPGVGEIAGGSLREDNYDKLKERLPKSGTELDWYLDLRKYGGVPTGGFGLGFERYLLLLLGLNNVKDVIPFPRWPHNCNL